MINSGTLVDRRLEAGHGDKVAIRCAGEDDRLTRSCTTNICRAGSALRRARCRPRGPRADDPRRHAHVPRAVPRRDAHRRGARAGVVPRHDGELPPLRDATPTPRWSSPRTRCSSGSRRARSAARSSRALMRDGATDTTPADIAPRRHGLLAVQRRLDRVPEGRRAPAPRHPVHVRDLRASEILRITEDDVTFSSTKLYHAYGLGNNLTFPYWVGATTVLRPGKPDPRGLLETAREHRPTLFFSVPTLYGAMVNLPDAPTFDLSSVRFCVSRRRAARARGPAPLAGGFGLDIVDGIGSTEMLHIYCSNRPGDVRPGTSGKPVPGYELRAARRARPAGGRGRGRQPARARRQRARLLLASAREDQGRDQGRAGSSPATATASTRTATTCTRAAPTT